MRTEQTWAYGMRYISVPYDDYTLEDVDALMKKQSKGEFLTEKEKALVLIIADKRRKQSQSNKKKKR